MMLLKRSLKKFLEWVFDKVGLQYHAASPADRARMIWGYVDSHGNQLPRVRISSTAVFQNRTKIELSDNVYVGHYVVLDGSGGLLVGEGTQIGAHTCIMTHSSHLAIRLYRERYTEVREEDMLGFIKQKTTIGKYVFIGVGARILPGVTIGDYALIGAGAVVVKDVPAYAVALGNPAKITGEVQALDAPYFADHPDLRSYPQGTDAQET